VLAKELRNARMDAGMTQEKLAAKAGISREYVNYLERGKRSPTVAVFVRICHALEIYPPDLLARAIPPRQRHHRA
jgi:transcriptional regulator with XRE-family HTH domain